MYSKKHLCWCSKKTCNICEDVLRHLILFYCDNFLETPSGGLLLVGLLGVYQDRCCCLILILLLLLLLLLLLILLLLYYYYYYYYYVGRALVLTYVLRLSVLIYGRWLLYNNIYSKNTRFPKSISEQTSRQKASTKQRNRLLKIEPNLILHLCASLETPGKVLLVGFSWGEICVYF